MLGKLIKYEFKATGRTFLPLYGIILLVACIHRLLGRNTQGIFVELNKIGDFMTLALVALFIALGVITLVMTIQRFQKNLLTDEGYLMFTLPVKIRSLIFSKLFVALIWVILSSIVGFVTFAILFLDGVVVKEIWQALMQLPEVLKAADYTVDGVMIMSGLQMIVVLVQVVLSGLLGYIQFVVTVYLALAIGQFPAFQKYRTAASFIAFFVINMIVGWGIGMIGSDLLGEAILGINMNQFFAVINIMTAVVIVGLFEGTHYILKKHLNLE
ncbi:MAG: ABC transporter permease [Niameybacter sp.]|uniref:hypothetical protein n=1 Tax=Niameybacter sp. TaxID=2033640 RepID=UPI002FC8A53C